MNAFILAIFAAVLFIAWLLPLIIVFRYRRVVIPKRYEEIREQFLREAPPGSSVVPDRPLAPAPKAAVWLRSASLRHAHAAIDRFAPIGRSATQRSSEHRDRRGDGRAVCALPCPMSSLMWAYHHHRLRGQRDPARMVSAVLAHFAH
jgi:hypothetical protein